VGSQAARSPLDAYLEALSTKRLQPAAAGATISRGD